MDPSSLLAQSTLLGLVWHTRVRNTPVFSRDLYTTHVLGKDQSDEKAVSFGRMEKRMNHSHDN